MAYHGLIPICKRHLMGVKAPPAILEVGVDRGVTFLTMATFLVRTREQFTAIGVDVLVQEQVSIMLDHLDRTEAQRAQLFQENSLDVLPRMVEHGMSFDLILIDGDHNYHTVSNELRYLELLANPGAMVVMDDVYSTWGARDLFYANRPGYEGVSIATKPIETEKHGVKVALDDWLAVNLNWQQSQPIQSDAVVLQRRPT